VGRPCVQSARRQGSKDKTSGKKREKSDKKEEGGSLTDSVKDSIYCQLEEGFIDKANGAGEQTADTAMQFATNPSAPYRALPTDASVDNTAAVDATRSLSSALDSGEALALDELASMDLSRVMFANETVEIAENTVLTREKNIALRQRLAQVSYRQTETAQHQNTSPCLTWYFVSIRYKQRICN